VVNNSKLIKFYPIGIMLLMFIGAVCTSTQGILLTDFINEYNLESSRQGLMSAFQSIGNVLALFLIGIFVGKTRKVNILTFSAFLIPFVFFILTQKPLFIILLASYCVYGVAVGFIDSLASSIMVDLYHEKASQYMNVLHGVYGAGGLAGPVFLHFLRGAGLEWNGILSVLCGLSLVAALLYSAAAYPAFKSDVKSSGSANAITLSDIINCIGKRKQKILLFISFLYGAHQIGMTVWMTRYISEYLNKPEYGSAALSLFWVGIATSRLVISRFNFKPEKVILYGHFLSGLFTAVGVLSGNGFVMLLCCGLSGFFEGAILPLALYLSCSWISDNTALGSSLVLFVHCAGSIVTPPFMGAVINYIGITGGMIIPAICSFTAAFGTLALIKTLNSIDVN